MRWSPVVPSLLPHLLLLISRSEKEILIGSGVKKRLKGRSLLSTVSFDSYATALYPPLRYTSL